MDATSPDVSATADGPTHNASTDPIYAAFYRAYRALNLAIRDGLPFPSVRLYPDGSAEFIMPGRLARALKGNAGAFTALIGSNRVYMASTVAEDPDAVSIRVPGDVLGREED